MSSDESLSEASRDLAGPSRPRIVRGQRSSPPAADPPQPEKPAEDPLLTRFIITQPHHPAWRVRIAWEHCNGDARAATNLLDNPSFQPRDPSLPARPVVTIKTPQRDVETGRVKEVDEATKAERQRIRELGKKSAIYTGHKLQTPVTPSAPKSTNVVTKQVPPSPVSPVIAKPRTRPLKRKVVDSDSEPDWGDSDDGSGDSQKGDDVNELRALEYFNSAAAEELQELTGMYPAIVTLMYVSVTH